MRVRACTRVRVCVCVNIYFLGGKKKHLVLLFLQRQNKKISQHVKARIYAQKKMTAKLYIGGFHIYPPPRTMSQNKIYLRSSFSTASTLSSARNVVKRKIKRYFLPCAVHCHRWQRSQSESQSAVQEGRGKLQSYKTRGYVRLISMVFFWLRGTGLAG